MAICITTLCITTLWGGIWCYPGGGVIRLTNKLKALTQVKCTDVCMLYSVAFY